MSQVPQSHKAVRRGVGGLANTMVVGQGQELKSALSPTSYVILGKKRNPCEYLFPYL